MLVNKTVKLMTVFLGINFEVSQVHIGVFFIYWCLLYPWILHLWIQLNSDQKYLDKKILESSKKQEPCSQQLLTHHLHCSHNCLHSIYTVSGIKSNLEMEDGCRLYVICKY